MKVIVSAKYRGDQPYEMHSVDIHIGDEDLDEAHRQLPLVQRIDYATDVAAIRAIRFGRKKGALDKDEARRQLEQFKQRRGSDNSDS